MLRTIAALTAAGALTGGGIAAAAGPGFHRPDVPVPTLAINLPEVSTPAPDLSVQPPSAPQLTLRPTGCGTTNCDISDPLRFAGTVVSFAADTLTERTAKGRTYSATVNAATMVTCPPPSAIAAGHIFNPVISQPEIGSTPARPTLGDRYACSAINLRTGRAIAGAELGRGADGRLYWIAVALAPVS